MEINDKVRKILTSKFEHQLFEASLANLNDISNKLRYNNFAYSVRELARHFLESLSPEANVKECEWYHQEADNNKPTRSQRVKYAIQGGISDEALAKWGFDIDELKETIKAIVETINSLSKFTHINPEVFELTDEEVTSNSKKVLSTFQKFVETIDEYRDSLKDFLDGHIEDHMIDSVVSNFFENLDSLAPHYSLDYCEVSEYHILEITDQEIIVDVSGDLYVTLEYGSRQERREGDGLDVKANFPFETQIKYEISEDFPQSTYEIMEYDVDTSEWYGD